MLVKNILKIGMIAFNLAAFVYFLIPFPNLPDLPNSLRSVEPGDTIQLKNVKAYYTNSNRNAVTGFYLKNTPHPFIYKINHPPEYARQVIKATTQTYYLEEYVLPFKGSFFVNGYEWKNDVFTKPDARGQNKLLVGTQLFDAKITLKWIPAIFPINYFIFLLTQVLIFFALKKIPAIFK